MTERKLSWLSVAVFISKNNWALAIRDAIEPFLNDLKGEMLFQISFNFDSKDGEHLRLALLIDKSRKDYLVRKANFVFLEFFKKNSLLPRENDINEKTAWPIFMPIYQNNIVFDLFMPKVTPYPPYWRHTENLLSKTVISVFAAETLIDDELILTFAVYVLFICYKVIRSYKNSYLEKWLGLYQRKVTSEYYETVYTVYNAFIASTNEIYIQVFNNEEPLEWINVWELEFEKIWKDVEERNESEFFFNHFDKLFNYTLNINGNLEMTLGVLISETLRNKIYSVDAPMAPIED